MKRVLKYYKNCIGKFKIYLVLRSGFEPESSARKAGMIGRATPPEHIASHSESFNIPW